MATQQGTFLFWHWQHCATTLRFYARIKTMLISVPSSCGQNRPPTHEWRLFVLKSDLLHAGIPRPSPAATMLLIGLKDGGMLSSGHVPHNFRSYLHVEVSDIEGHIAAGFNLRC